MDNLSSLSDDQLVSLYVKGNNEAFDVLLHRHESKVYTYIYYTVKNKELAEDLFQDVFIRVLTRLRAGTYTGSGKFGAWVLTVARNLILDHFRLSKDGNNVSQDSEDNDLVNSMAFADTSNVETDMIDRQTLDELKSLIALLPKNQREAIILRYYQELSFKEIADITGVSINTALGRIRYAISNLRRLAEENDITLAS